MVNFEESPCGACDRQCDIWDSQYCCELCRWTYGDTEPPCDTCDDMDI